MTASRGRALIGALIAGACLGGCEPASRPPKTAIIVVDQLAFGPAPADLHVGDTLRWVNHDIFQHSATAKDGQFDVELPAGGAGQVVLKRSGTIAYVCRYHPGMAGQITVAE